MAISPPSTASEWSLGHLPVCLPLYLKILREYLSSSKSYVGCRGFKYVLSSVLIFKSYLGLKPKCKQNNMTKYDGAIVVGPVVETEIFYLVNFIMTSLVCDICLLYSSFWFPIPEYSDMSPESPTFLPFVSCLP